MSDTSIAVTPGSGTNVDGYSIDNGNFRQAIVIGDGVNAANVAPVDPNKGVSVRSFQRESDLLVTATGASAAAVTATLPAVAGQFHYITSIIITEYATALLTASATPVVVTTTNMPGAPAFTFPAAASPLGTIPKEMMFTPTQPIKSAAANSITTIVAPATTAVIWRITVTYYTAP